MLFNNIIPDVKDSSGDSLESCNNNIQLAENEDVDPEEQRNDSIRKRELLSKTKIVKQTWSILEIYQKIKSGKLILNPDYQRRDIWKADKQVSFIESLFMGIVIPPIYVVEIPGQDLLEDNKYEVVDGKQRLTTVNLFLQGNLKLLERYLEYFKDIYGAKNFTELREEFSEDINEFLSSVLDIYVITANSPEFTKYDIFARLNKGAEKLKVNEIRKAIYRSDVLLIIEHYVKENCNKEYYTSIFTANSIKRYDDYGRFFSSIAYYCRIDESTMIVNNYNSRPRDMINNVLSGIQRQDITLKDDVVLKIIDETIKLLSKMKDVSGNKYLVDICVYFAIKYPNFYDKLNDIINDSEIRESLVKSPTTTSNVNKRIERLVNILNE